MGGNLLPEIMKWTGIGLISFLILAGFYMIWMLFQYNIVVYKLVLGENGDAKNKKYFIKKLTKMKAKRTTHKGVEQWKYLYSKLTTPPIPERNILPHSGLFAPMAAFVYEIERNVLIPSSIDFSINSPAVIHFNPLPYDVRRAAALELQEIAKEFADPGFMAKYGNYIYGFLTVLFCLILAGAVIWMTYKYIGGELGAAANAANSLSEAFKSGVTQTFNAGG